MAKPSVHFQLALEGSKEQLLNVGSAAEEIIDLAVRCYFTKETALGFDVSTLSAEMNRSARHIDEIVLQLLTNKQLTSAEMRHLMAFIKVNVILEEIGNLAVQIADQSLSFTGLKIDWPDNVPKLGLAVCGQMRAALKALADADRELAVKVIDRTTVIALMGNEAWVHLVEKMTLSQQVIQSGVSALIIVRALEKIAHHANTIAEWVLFWLGGIKASRVVSQSPVLVPSPVRKQRTNKRCH
jgi:phosphate transport system protein